MRELEDIASIVAQAQKDLLEIKQKQFAGSSNIKVFESASASTWDINQSVTITNPPGARSLVCCFIADTQQAPFTEFDVEAQIDNVPYSLPATGAAILINNDFISASALNTLNLTQDQAERAVFYGLSLVPTSYPQTKDIKVKFRVYSTDTGTVQGSVV